MSLRTVTSIIVCSVLGILGLFGAGRITVADAAPKAKAAKSLHFMRQGKGPAVVFLHALGGDSSVFIDELMRLESTHTVLLVDLPGHGQSPPAQPHIEFMAIARQITDLIHAQRLAPAVIVGHSVGGTIAGYIALADPKAVRGLVIIDSMFAPYPIAQEDRDKLGFQMGRDKARAMREHFGPMTKNARQLDKIVANCWRVPGQTLVNYLEFASERDDLRSHVREIQAPVHVLASPLLTEGQSDPTRIQLALGQVGYAGLVNLTFDYFPNAKHWIHWDDPAGFDTSLDKFLRRVEGNVQPPPARPHKTDWMQPKPVPTERRARPLAKAFRQ